MKLLMDQIPDTNPPMMSDSPPNEVNHSMISDSAAHEESLPLISDAPPHEINHPAMNDSPTDEINLPIINDFSPSESPVLVPSRVSGPRRQGSQRKSVTWSFDPYDEPTNDGRNSTASQYGKGKTQGEGSISSISRIHRRRKYNLSNRASSSWWKRKCFPCCSPSVSTAESESDEYYDDFRPKNLKMMNEDDIVNLLQQATQELFHRPTNYDIESEIQRWHKMLENEYKTYEESGKPKFKYKWFRKNQYLTIKKHPIYGTNYENYRKLEVRLEEFRFGTSTATDAFGTIPEVKYGGDSYENESKNAAYWRSDDQVFYANLALVCCANNFMRFPQACYANGGFTFFLTYCLMLAAVGQPLLYFEMVLGQFSLNGPSGFARLHPYAIGLPYAVAFVSVVFGTARSVYLAYSILYSLISLVFSPGVCGWWSSKDTKCIPYKSFEMYSKLLQSERMTSNPTHEKHVFSVELFFREVILNEKWKSDSQVGFINWKFLFAYILVCLFALVPTHYNPGGSNTKRYLRYSSIIIPAMISILFLHQIFSRGGMSLATTYFLSVDSEHVSALSIWSEAFELVLSTLGIGYGFHWYISGNVSIDYRNAYRMSWRICGFAAFFGLISSLVVFCEIGIVGEFTMDLSHYLVFHEHLGISFVCYSGALYKVGSNTVATIFIFFLLFVLYGMWSQVMVIDIILRWFEHGHIIKGIKRPNVKRKRSVIFILITLLVIVISPYYLANGGSVLASENVFGGTLAAYIVVLIELLVASYLYGFARFLADLEIMVKRRTPTMFQFQIRYVVIPTIVIFMGPMILNVYIFPSVYVERNKLGWLFYFGLMANFAPIAILLICIPFDLTRLTSRNVNKVTPQPIIYALTGKSTMDKIRQRYPIFEPTFMAKENAPSQQSHGFTIRSELYEAVQHNMEFIHECENFVKVKFTKLLRFKINQRRWLKVVVGVLTNKVKIRSMRGLVTRIMLALKCRTNRIDIRFLKKALEQIVSLTFFSAIRKLQRMPMQEMLLYMTDQLLELTIFRTKEQTPVNVLLISSSSSSDLSDEETPSSASSYEEENTDNELQLKLIGHTEMSAEERRILLTIRVKRGLDIPHNVEMSVLKFLRRQRAKQEREQSCWTQGHAMPIDHFVPSSISNKNKEKICFTIFHAVVVEGSDHYVLKKLPVPRPPIVRVTKSFVQRQPGKTLTDKFARIVTKRMHRNIGRILEKRNLRDMSKAKLRRHLWKVSDRVDDDVYDFLDRILTCVIVIVPDSEAKKSMKPTYYLTPRTIRKATPVYQPKRRQALTDFEITSYSVLNYKQLQQEYWERLLEEQQPSDIRYHSDSSKSSDSIGSVDDLMTDAKSSSGSSSTLSPDGPGSELPSERSSLASQSTSSFTSMTTAMGEKQRIRSQYILTGNESLLHRDIRILKKKSGFAVPGLQEDAEDVAAVSVDIEKIKHISARRWKHSRDLETKLGSDFPRYTANEIRLHRSVEMEANRKAIEAVTSKSMELLKRGNNSKNDEMRNKKAISLESFRHLIEGDAEFKMDINKGRIFAFSKDRKDTTSRLEEKLKNVNTEQSYIAYGKTLIVDHGVKLSVYSLSKSKYNKQRPGQRNLTA